MNSLKNKKPFLIAIGVAMLATCLLAWFFLIPRAALINLPYRWSKIPLGQKRAVLEKRLGKASTSDSTSLLSKGEEWVAYRTNGVYKLKINYNRDTVATDYVLSFDYHLGFLHKHYILTRESLH